MIVYPANLAKGFATVKSFRAFPVLCAAGFLLAAFSPAALAQTQVTLSWNQSTDSTVLGYRLYEGGASRHYTNVVDVGNVTTTVVSSLQVGGTYYFALTAYNTYGLESPLSAEVSYTAAVSNPPPSVVLTAPASGASFAAPATLNLSANVTTNGHAITQVQFYNGSTLLGSDTVPPYNFTWSGVSAGSYSLSAQLVYDGGSTLASAPATVTVTNLPPPPSAPPAIALTAPASGASFAAPATLNLSANVTTNGHTITQVQFYNGSTLLGSDTVPPYNFTWSGVSAGSYSLSAQLVYDGGSTLASAPASVTVTNLPPPPSPQPSAIAQITLSWNQSADSTVLGYRVYEGGASRHYTNVVDVGNVTTTVVSNLLAGGTYYFALTAYNTYGLESPLSAEVSYTVPLSNPPPSVALTAPVSGASYCAPATIALSANVTTNGHTITQVQFYNGSTLLGSGTVPPYNLTWSCASAGSYSVTARVVYDAGSTADSAPATITVTNLPPPPSPAIALTAPASGATFAAPATINLSANVTTNGHSITQVQFYNGSTLLGSDTVPPYNFTWSGVSTGSYSLSAQLVYDGGSTLASAPVSVTVTNPPTPPALPAPWQTADIGSVGVAGSATASNGVFSVSGSGTIGTTSDTFRFVYQPLSADGEIRARIYASQLLNNDWAGVMIRESLTPGSCYGLMGLTSGNVVRMSARVTTGTISKNYSSGTATPPNLWVRLVRTGNTLYGYKSTDGVNWGKPVTKFNASMAANIYIGLAVASGNSTALNHAVFDNLTVVP